MEPEERDKMVKHLLEMGAWKKLSVWRDGQKRLTEENLGLYVKDESEFCRKWKGRTFQIERTACPASTKD